MTNGIEQELIAGILNNDESIIAQFVRIYEDRVYALAFRMLKNGPDAQEVSQDVFLKALRTMSDFKGDCKLSTWIYRINYTACLDVLKKRKRRGYESDIEEDNGSLEWSDLEDAISILEQKEQRAIIDEAMLGLKAIDATLLDLYYLQGVSSSEIAAITELSQGNIRIRLMRARKNLGIQLEKSLPQETLREYGHRRE